MCGVKNRISLELRFWGLKFCLSWSIQCAQMNICRNSCLFLVTVFLLLFFFLFFSSLSLSLFFFNTRRKCMYICMFLKKACICWQFYMSSAPKHLYIVLTFKSSAFPSLCFNSLCILTLILFNVPQIQLGHFFFQLRWMYMWIDFILCNILKSILIHEFHMHLYCVTVVAVAEWLVRNCSVVFNLGVLCD